MKLFCLLLPEGFRREYPRKPQARTNQNKQKSNKNKTDEESYSSQTQNKITPEVLLQPGDIEDDKSIWITKTRKQRMHKPAPIITKTKDQVLYACLAFLSRDGSRKHFRFY